MSAFLEWLFPDDFMPHGHCYLWRPDVLWLHVGSDALIAASYFSIPLALAYFVRERRQVLPYWWIPVLFAAFIFLCGSTHVMNIWTVWNPDYVVDGFVKLGTAIASAGTAVMLFRVLPQAMMLRTPIELQREVDARTIELRIANERLHEEIAARERTEAALRASEARFRATFDDAGVGIAHVAPDGRWLQVNEALCQLTGYSQAQLLAGNFSDITHPEDLETDLEHVRRLLAGEADSYSMEKRYLHREGTIVWVMLTVTLMRDAAGRPDYFIAVIGDISARKRAEEALRRAEESMRAVVDHVIDGIITIDRTGRIEAFNPAAERLFGYRREEVLGRNVKVLMPEPYGSEHDRYLRNYLAGGPRRIIGIGREVVGRRKDGSTFPMELAVSEFSIGPQRYFSGIVRDITERKQAEQALRAERDRAQLYFDVAGPMLLVLGRDGRIERINHSGLRLLGHEDEAQVIGRDWFAEFVPEPARAEVRDSFDELVTGRRESPETYENPIVCRDGTQRLIAWRNTLLHDAAGHVIATVSSGEDVTERKRLELELRQTIEKLAEADRRKDEFLATLAHELRNPLAPIRSALHFMKLKGSQEPALQSAREVVDRQVGHMVRLVDDLLEVSRITSGRIALHKERVPLDQVVASALEAAAPAISAGGHALEVRLPEQPVHLEVDPTRLSQVLLNLLNNAAKFTPAGGRIAVNARLEPRSVSIGIRDSGVGIPPDRLEDIFGLFSQLEGTRRQTQGGLGIGLTLARQLTRLHDGELEAHSAGEGRGSEFVVRLPLPEQPAAAAGEAPGGEAAPAGEPARRILVVDDNLDAAESLAVLLRLSGHEVREAHDGLAAVEITEAFGPDVVLMDIGMPKMDGFEATRRIRALPLAHQPLIVALTGWGQEADRRRSREAGIDHHLVKPVDLDELLALLRRT